MTLYVLGYTMQSGKIYVCILSKRLYKTADTTLRKQPTETETFQKLCALFTQNCAVHNLRVCTGNQVNQ